MQSTEQRIEMIRNDREHGSRWLVGEAISLLHDLASDRTTPPDEVMKRVHAAAQELAQARPAMAAIAGAVARIVSVQGGPTAIAQEARRLREDYDQATQRIADFARPVLTGMLMTLSISGTILDVLTACASQIERVIVLEGRPRFEGRETASTLAGKGMNVTLITDAQADIFLPQCRAVVTGADTVLANGDVLNKAGTALLGWAAQGHSIPFYVLCETLKISPHSWTGDLRQLEEKEPEEVLEKPIKGVTVRNFYFDHTPTRLVTRIITEQGMMDAHDIQQIATQVGEMMEQI